MMVIRLTAVILMAWLPSLSLACGHCLEDRIAAVYDHALMAKTIASKQKMLYFAWDGPVNRDETTRLRILRQSGFVSGITPQSVRVSIEPATMALAYDPLKTNPKRIESALELIFSKEKIFLILLPLQN
jgi:hypothetical protein